MKKVYLSDGYQWRPEVELNEKKIEKTFCTHVFRGTIIGVFNCIGETK
jgi:cystathionine beta-lyase family protein involved in aluminum resistance